MIPRSARARAEWERAECGEATRLISDVIRVCGVQANTQTPSEGSGATLRSCVLLWHRCRVRGCRVCMRGLREQVGYRALDDRSGNEQLLHRVPRERHVVVSEARTAGDGESRI